jgi:ABC-type multidrug transport system fused ATPase/permease subunit
MSMSSRVRAKRVVQEYESRRSGPHFDLSVVLRMGPYIRPHLVRVVFLTAALLLYTATVVALPKLIQVTIDDYVTAANLIGLRWIAVGFIVVGAVQMVTDIVHKKQMAYVGQKTLLALRLDMFTHLQRLSMSYYDRNEAGKTMSRVQDDVRQLQSVLSIGVSTFSDVLSLGGIIAMMLWMDPLLGGLTLTVAPVMVLVLAWWQRFARRAFMRARIAIADVHAGLQENIAGARAIQSLHREGVNIKDFNRANRENMLANMEATRYSAILPPAVDFLSATALAIVVLVGGSLAIRGTLEVGIIIAFALYVQHFFEPIQSLTSQFSSLQRAMVAGRRIFELLDIEPEVVEKPDAAELATVKGEIRYEGVYFHYDPDTPVLKRIDLQIEPGQTVAFVGPTGAGKTSIMSLLLRFYDVTDGRILIDGQDIRDVTLASLARQMGVVPQEPYLFSATSVADNIRYNRPDVSNEEIVRAATAVGAHDFIMALPKGYDSPLQERGGNLSMGQRQLISFARAIVGDPRVLLLDEATANIDTESERMIQKALDELMRGRTAIVIAHRLSTVRHADNIVVVDKGQIVEQGTHAELIAKGGRYSVMSAANTLELDEVE